jgi:mannose-6-phosphate isomerase-like protein (cupin superfamily)
MITDKQSAHYYQWGAGCESWDLLANEGLSVKQELMPPNTREVLHYHAKAQQYFYILSGTATFVIDEVEYVVNKSQGISIKPNSRHYIANKENTDLEFLVISQPAIKSDRVEV